MADFVDVARSSELKDGAMKMVSASGREILLARVGDKIYAANNRCPHLRGNLSRGKLEGTIVTCPRHASQFDLTDGRIIRWTGWAGLLLRVSKALKPPRPLKTYKVKVEGDTILVEI
ncbi:MAG: Rieske 2Fe-2S domain-containing protein [Dehalococcoidales bacterium]